MMLSLVSLVKSVLKHRSRSQVRAPVSCRFIFSHAISFNSPDRTRLPVCEMALCVCKKRMTLLGAGCRGRWWITAAAAGAGFVTWRKEFKGMLQGFYYRGNFGHSKVQLLYPEKSHCSQPAPFRENTWPFISSLSSEWKKVSAVSKPLDKSSAISPAGVK